MITTDSLVASAEGLVRADAYFKTIPFTYDQVYELRTGHGNILRCSMNTKFRDHNGTARPLSYLTHGATITMQSEPRGYGTEGSREDGILLGLLTNGFINEGQGFAFINLTEEIECLFDQVTALVSKATQSIKTVELFISSNKQVLVGGSILMQWLRTKVRSPELLRIAVPNCIMYGSRVMQEGYLSALAVSGHANILHEHSGRIPIMLGFKNEVIQSQIQTLLLNHRIVSHKENSSLSMSMINFSLFVAHMGIYGRFHKAMDNILCAFEPTNKTNETFITTVDHVRPYEKTSCIEVDGEVIANGLYISN